MEKQICRDIILLSQKAADATPEDAQIGQDLLDTLAANRERCVGMAANMIGIPKKIIVFDDEGTLCLMYNPVIIKSAGKFKTEEGCLSLDGTRPCERYRTIKVEYQDTQFRKRIKTYTGWTAQIIQHEIDHLSGIII